ncbi:helix-turn-helix transcriptional regulator [Rubritalea tangerina]|uniref:Helix-turn-helix transcriptional regulator n=1 Tax=Rubritalea tangerina TaxID=430798 RepID=A0ABW4ZF65_9BACT
MIEFLLHSYGEFNKQSVMHPAVWPHFDLLFIHEGRLDLMITGKGRVSLGAGEGVLLFPQTAFSPFGRKSEARASVQHFSLGDGQGLPEPFTILAGKTHASIVRKGPRNPQLEADIERALALAVAEPTPMTQLMRESLLTLILGEFLRATVPNPARETSTSGIVKWAETQSLDTLSVEVLAAKSGLTPSGLRRRFLKDLKVTPQSYLLRLRLNEAARLLRETTLPLKEIATRLGYSSNVAFHNAFKKSRQQTPREYRMGHRPKA